MRSTTGLALVSDFDGTLADLRVDWPALRAQLEVKSILELWIRGAGAWSEVTFAECAAAATARPVSVGHELALSSMACAVLTNNSELAVRRYLDRHPTLERRVCAVVGRESLDGPKNDETRFTSGFAQCVDALSERLGHVPTIVGYVGDQDYELEFARRLTSTVIDVRTTSPSPDEKSVYGP